MTMISAKGGKNIVFIFEEHKGKKPSQAGEAQANNCPQPTTITSSMNATENKLASTTFFMQND